MPLPCSLQLDVYFPPSLDGSTDETVIDWSVSTDPDHAFPYLLGPRQYATQEIDPITGAATIGTLEIGVIDAPIDPDDQDTGWMTARIHDIVGRRCRLRRYVNATVGYIVVADGPAGSPKLDASYSAYRWTIRDTRDTERKIKAFAQGGVTSIVPRGSIYGWGHHLAGGAPQVLLPSTLSTPMTGVMSASNFGMALGTINLQSHYTGSLFDDADPLIVDDPNLVITDEGAKAMALTQVDENAFVPRSADVLWRKVGDVPWNVSRPRSTVAFQWPFASFTEARLAPTDRDPVRSLNSVLLYLEPGATTPAPAGFPVDGDAVEFVIRYRGPATEELPYYVEGALGDVLTNLYTGVYENPVNDGITGITYDPAGIETLPRATAFIQFDPAALAPMTEQVLFRQTSVVDDGRAFAESMLYQPSGWMPALDNDGAISPVSRSRPAVIDAALTIMNAHVIPSTNWNTGARVISSIEYTYNRYFKPAADAGFKVFSDGLAMRPIVVDYDDPDSFKRYGDNPESFDSSAFSSAGTPDGLNLPGQTEQSLFFAQLAKFDLLDRFRAGVQVISIAALRSRIPNVRTGSWIPWELSWFPDRASGLRGSVVDAAQIVSIRDDDCTWRTLTLEESGAAGALVDQPGFYSDLAVDTDDFEPGFFSDLIEDSDEESGAAPPDTSAWLTVFADIPAIDDNDVTIYLRLTEDLPTGWHAKIYIAESLSAYPDPVPGGDDAATLTPSAVSPTTTLTAHLFASSATRRSRFVSVPVYWRMQADLCDDTETVQDMRTVDLTWQTAS
jgi:hypothetical protein